MTTGISLVRENTASMEPPRSLWVSFPLGRPLGKPLDPHFQHRVIRAALGLFSRSAGPVLEDYPEDAPDIEPDASASCPISFQVATTDADSWRARLLRELEILRPWHALSKRRRKGRTLFGVSGLSMEQNFSRLAELLDSSELPVNDLKWFKEAIEDAKVFYLEALSAQPGQYNQKRLQQTLWKETQFGAGLTWFYAQFKADEKLRLIARIIAPREVVESSTGEELDLMK